MLLALLALFALDAHAAEIDEGKRLQAVEAALQSARARAAELAAKADSVAAEIGALQAKLVESAMAAQESEERLIELESELARLEKSESATRADLTAERGRLIETLAALQRLSMQPREAMILRPSTPIDTVRSAMLLRVAVPTLQDRAAGLREKLQRLGDLRTEIARRRLQQEETLTALQDENARLSELFAEMRELQKQTEAERSEAEQQTASLAAEAKNLEQLLKELEKQRAEARQREEAEAEAARRRQEAERERQQQEAMLALPPEPEEEPEIQSDVALSPPPPVDRGNIRSFPKDGVGIVPPARGVTTVSYGEPNDAGIKSRGVTLETRPAARVVAPFDGQVVFRGPFRGYGEILLIEHADGYHTLLAGLGRTDATVGQWLVAGEPVGIMGPADDGNPKLYVELRRRGNPIDPAPWLGLRDN